MNAHLHTELANAFQTPAIRHLAWLCQAPQLLHAPITFNPLEHLPANYLNVLAAWDKDMAAAPAILSEPPQRRLGFYFERLYQVLLEHLLGWPILLKNQQIQSKGRTIGELDFVVHNTAENRTEHHEIAIKFYLGVSQSASATLWYGPNARDRLDIKTTSLLEKQSRRTLLPETHALLAEHQISGPITPRIFMPGYLFYPDNMEVTAPDYVPQSHLRGRWMYLAETRMLDPSNWALLNKPHWIGNWTQTNRPDAELTRNALAKVETHSIPQLFAIMKKNGKTGQWQEADRMFVVPERWP